MQFKIEQVALFPPNVERALNFLRAIGLEDWAKDHVKASGRVLGVSRANEADLHFNYQAIRGFAVGTINGEITQFDQADQEHPEDAKPLELEVLNYTSGASWMDARPTPAVSHLGMHVTEEELAAWRAKMAELGIGLAQEVITYSHTNPVIAGKRTYNYVIFDTFDIIGADLKFIVRRDVAVGFAAGSAA